ncbi:hypothetical protein KIN20_022685 [Parelaphostrongylus tenuis]|uniref:Uncharacterized protein n=1 Tax=Parelaphostrongylus tenuis TaxID=148309 RepID=A0AAD5NBR4_PARTN|nr:hypothetical protein KIN20_022685 [Parelaphostrongylus tenuis]
MSVPELRTTLSISQLRAESDSTKHEMAQFKDEVTRLIAEIENIRMKREEEYTRLIALIKDIRLKHENEITGSTAQIKDIRLIERKIYVDLVERMLTEIVSYGRAVDIVRLSSAIYEIERSCIETKIERLRLGNKMLYRNLRS